MIGGAIMIRSVWKRSAALRRTIASKFWDAGWHWFIGMAKRMTHKRMQWADKVCKPYLEVQGSFTVEAALVFPIVVFCIFQFLDQGIELYCQIIEITGNQKAWKGFDPASRFRQFEFLDNLLHP